MWWWQKKRQKASVHSQPRDEYQRFQPRADYRAQILDGLRAAFVHKGWCDIADLNYLPIATATKYRVVDRLIEDGIIERVARGHLRLAPEFERSEAERRLEAQEASEAQDPQHAQHTPKDLSPAARQLLAGRPSVRMSVLELQSHLPPAPVGNRTEPITNTPADDFSWEALANLIPPPVAPEVRRQYDIALGAGNPIENCFHHCHRVLAPKLYKEHIYKLMRQYSPRNARYSWAEFEADVALFQSQGKALEDLLEDAKRRADAATKPGLPQPFAPSPVALRPNGKPKEIVSWDASTAHEERELQDLYKGPMTKRTVVWPKEEGPSFERSLSEINKHGGGAWLGFRAR
jgi:hypothetical protein